MLPRISGDKLMEKRYEDYAYILDYLIRARSRAAQYRVGTQAQVIGDRFFTLLEVIVKKNLNLKPLDRIYVGKDIRKEVTYIIGRIGYDELTTTAKMELEAAITKIAIKHEKQFIEFFNTAQPITLRMHALELIPGIGKKYMWQILDERDKTLFRNFADLKQRANIPTPQKLIVKRILEELTGESRERLFVRPE